MAMTHPGMLEKYMKDFGGVTYGEQRVGLHLMATHGFLDDSAFNRAFWTYSDIRLGFDANEFNRDARNGELLVTSTYTMKEYYNRPEETENVYIEVDGKIYCRMGDFVSMKPDGELIYMERSADVIKHKGYRVSASEIEAVLQDHSTVINACVIGIPDEKVGERIKAIVVLKEDARGVGGVELIKWCRESLASYKVPSYIEFRDMLPKSKVGKLLRREVRDDERRKIEKK